MTLLPQFLAFASTLALMMVLSRWINRQVQIIGLRLSGDMNVAVMIYYLLMFPGIVLHELSHYLMARLLRMQVGSFALGPKKRRNAIELGSVTVASGGAIRDSLVGLAPFLAGTAVLLLISYYVFDVAALGEAWRTAGWAGVWDNLGDLACSGFLAVGLCDLRGQQFDDAERGRSAAVGVSWHLPGHRAAGCLAVRRLRGAVRRIP